ncbi:hypothetical protein EVA_13712 [gut metagenome]|uniref:Uncharacterized protein n=1 Tax=gut metagenome TaxID=749906 RepID=J9G8U1_9ZZZZ
MLSALSACPLLWLNSSIRDIAVSNIVCAFVIFSPSLLCKFSKCQAA